MLCAAAVCRYVYQGLGESEEEDAKESLMFMQEEVAMIPLMMQQGCEYYHSVQLGSLCWPARSTHETSTVRVMQTRLSEIRIVSSHCVQLRGLHKTDPLILVLLCLTQNRDFAFASHCARACF